MTAPGTSVAPSKAIAGTEKRLSRIARLTLGGVISGGFVGILVGAALGTLIGISQHAVAYGLDGALFGSVGCGILGGVCGIYLGITEKSEETVKK